MMRLMKVKRSWFERLFIVAQKLWAGVFPLVFQESPSTVRTPSSRWTWGTRELPKLNKDTSEHLSEVARNIPIPLIYCFMGTLWQGEGQMLDKGWGWRITNICKSCYLHIKCFPANSLVALMWRWCLNSKQAALQLVVEGLGRCEMGQGEAPKTWFTRVQWEWYKNHGI